MLNRLRKFLRKGFFRNMEPYDIDMDELKSKRENGAIIVDVRSSQEYNEGHIDKAINIPEYKINYNLEKILKDKNAEIVLYCSSGIRSKNAYKKMKKLGYKNVFNLYQGIDNY